jgi:hypothetical protein
LSPLKEEFERMYMTNNDQILNETVIQEWLDEAKDYGESKRKEITA